MKDNFEYTGKELHLFRHAVNWKKYFSKKIKPFISGKVLEVGAGMGENIDYLMNDSVISWTCLEPDQRLADSIKTNADVKMIKGTLADLDTTVQYDCIIYIDVLEHIEDDVAEMKKAGGLLKENGRIIILSPAYSFLMSDFDKAIGHFRRYNKKSLRQVMQINNLQEEKLFYLESAGTLLLFINKTFTRRSYPSESNIKIWDRFIIPVSKITDALSGYFFGKTIIGIWKLR